MLVHRLNQYECWFLFSPLYWKQLFKVTSKIPTATSEGVFNCGGSLCYTWHWWFLLSGKLHLLASMTFPLLINFESFRLFLFCLLHGLLSHHFSPLKWCSSSEFSPGPATVMIPHCLWAFSSILMASTTISRLVIPKSIGLVPNFRLPGWRAESIWMDTTPRCPPRSYGSAGSKWNLPSSPSTSFPLVS